VVLARHVGTRIETFITEKLEKKSGWDSKSIARKLGS
jgi:hypothetical protein